MDRFDYERAIRSSDLPWSVRLVLLTLATYADTDGSIPDRFSPSLTTLTEATGLDRRTVMRALNKAEAAGWVKRVRPPIHLARSEKAKTSYALGSPARGTQTLEARGTEALSPQRTRGTQPLELGAQVHGARGTVPLIPTNYTNHSPSGDDVTDEDRLDALRRRGARNASALLAAIRRDDPTQLADLDDEVRAHRADQYRRDRADAERAERRAGRTWRCDCSCADNAESATRCRWCGQPRAGR